MFAQKTIMKRSLIILLYLFGLYCNGQVVNIVKIDSITSDLHKSNLGKIIFMNRNIPLGECTEADFLTTFQLKKDCDLNIRVFMDNSITNYMHQLAPELSEEELNRKGNYQFSFRVDNILIYQENIHYGCGLKKSTTTTFRVPLIDSSGGDWWSVYLFERFIANGGTQELTKGKHQLTIEMRPYVKINEESDAMVGNLIASGSINLIVKPEKISSKQIAIQSIASNSGFEQSQSKYNQKKIKELNKAIALDEFKSITSIVVIKEGKLVLEEYFNNANRTTLHDTRSVGKSFTSTLMGIAIKEGYITNENQTLSSFYKLEGFLNPSTQKDSIKLVDLLTMSSAFNGSDSNSESPGNEENMYPTDNWVKFALDLPMEENRANGQKWDYFTAGVILLGDILNKSVPEGLEQYADKKLFKPLGINNYKWQYTPQNVVNTAGGLQMTSLELAKFGQLYKNNGEWNGQQILSSEWVKKTFTKQLQIPDRTNEFYGYLFWNKTFVVDGKNYETFYCAGNGGNKIFVFKDVPLTIVITAKAYNKSYSHSQVDKMIQEYILPSLLK